MAGDQSDTESERSWLCLPVWESTSKFASRYMAPRSAGQTRTVSREQHLPRASRDPELKHTLNFPHRWRRRATDGIAKKIRMSRHGRRRGAGPERAGSEKGPRRWRSGRREKACGVDTTRKLTSGTQQPV